MVEDIRVVARIYDSILKNHLAKNRQMAFVSGPRQVGKTTCCKNLADLYLNWDNQDDREDIFAGPAQIAKRAGLEKLVPEKPVILFDELHKYPKWKLFLKGFFDVYSDRAQVIVTGSSRMDVYRRGGDSLMGRYFLYRMHPYSIAEIMTQELPNPNVLFHMPSKIDDTTFNALWQHGGNPEPFLRRENNFTLKWQSLRLEQLVREDIRDLSNVQNIYQLETFVSLLSGLSAQRLGYSSLAKQVRVSVDTIRRWIATLVDFHFGFTLSPWYKSIPRALRKEPKWYLRDWVGVDDRGSRAETFVACHLKKAVDGWNNLGFGKFDMHYLQDKERREVDFLIVRNREPWLLVETKFSDSKLSPDLERFQKLLTAPYAMQVVLNANYVDANCFAQEGYPLVVPARTFLSQLM